MPIFSNDIVMNGFKKTSEYLTPTVEIIKIQYHNLFMYELIVFDDKSNKNTHKLIQINYINLLREMDNKNKLCIKNMKEYDLTSEIIDDIENIVYNNKNLIIRCKTFKVNEIINRLMKQ